MSMRSILRRLSGHIRQRPVAPTILMYHRVASVTRDPWDLAITPDVFDEQMTHLERNHLLLPLQVFVKQLVTGNLPTGAVAVTFDDGYRDNLINAKPILEKHGIPATLFLATGWVDSPSPFWWDELADMILGSRMPRLLNVRCDAEQLNLSWGEPTGLDLAESWRASTEPQTERQVAYLKVWRKLQRTSQTERHSAMISLRESLGSPGTDPLGRPMSAVEVRDFVSGAGLSLGAHTISHAALTCLTAGECQAEIWQSQLACRNYTGNVIGTFAYPYGDMNRDVRHAVAAAGFDCACSTRASHVDRNSFDCFALPRLAGLQGPLQGFIDKLLH